MKIFFSKPLFCPRFDRFWPKRQVLQSSHTQNNAGCPCIQLLLYCCFGVDLINLKLPKDVWFKDAKTQEGRRLHCEPFYKKKTDMVCIYKNLHDRNGRQASRRLFARSISIRRTSEARSIYSPEPDDLLCELCNAELLNANRNFLFEFTRACCQVVVV